MLRLLQSIFGGVTQSGYPESLVNEAIERAVDGTDPWLRGVSGYKKKLRPAVIRAIDYVVALVNAMPPPVLVHLGSNGENPALRGFFISAAEMRKIFAGDESLVAFLNGPVAGLSRVVALLVMEKQERVIFGPALSGEIIVRDVAQVTVSFDGHRLIDPQGDEQETRHHLMRRAFDHLLSLALKRITAAKSEREDLERRRTLLHAKLSLLEREGWGFDRSDSAEKLGVAELEERLGRIEAELQTLGGDSHALETYLAIVADLLGRPEEQLWAKSETIFVDRMGIKRGEAADDAPELTFSELFGSAGGSLVVVPVSLQIEELRGLMAG